MYLPYLNGFISVSKHIITWTAGCKCSDKFCAPDMVFATAVSLPEFGIEQKAMKNLQSQTRFDLKMLTLLSLKAAGLEATQHFPGRSCGLVLSDLLLRWCLSPGWNVGCFKLLWVLWAHRTSSHTCVHACVRAWATHPPHGAKPSSCTRRTMRQSPTVPFRHSLHGRRGCRW